jgi:hypothetical protein
MSISTLPQILDRLLDKGIVQTNDELDICCPDCVQDMNSNRVSVYTIASVETFLKFSEAIGFNRGNTPTCCTQITASVETSLKFNDAFGDSPTNPVPSCPTNFNSCMNTLKNSLTSEGIDRLLDKGIVEYGSLSGFSQICRIDEFIDLSISLDPQSSTKAEIIDRIIDKGIVVSCYDDEIVIASVETWLKYAEANGLTYQGAIPA